MAHLVVELEMEFPGGARIGSGGLGILDRQPAVQGVVRGQLTERQEHVADERPPCTIITGQGHMAAITGVECESAAVSPLWSGLPCRAGCVGPL